MGSTGLRGKKMALNGENQVVPRLVPDEPLPAYAFVPGMTPHPISDPAGHSFGVHVPPPENIDPDAGQQSKTYLAGFDLFNRCFYWESHEQWEGLWHACGRRGPTADFLKGLIKLAAAGVKHLEENPVGVRSHACRAAELWRATRHALDSERDFYLGFRIGDLISLAEAICQWGWPATAVILLPTFGSKPPVSL
jgi:predicted metal-dependent hydrolase